MHSEACISQLPCCTIMLPNRLRTKQCSGNLQYLCCRSDGCLSTTAGWNKRTKAKYLSNFRFSHQQLHSNLLQANLIKEYNSAKASYGYFNLTNGYLNCLVLSSDISDVFPSIIVIGALGRCGKGAIDLAHKVGIPE